MLFSYKIAIDIENESKQQNKYLDGMVSQFFYSYPIYIIIVNIVDYGIRLDGFALKW